MSSATRPILGQRLQGDPDGRGCSLAFIPMDHAIGVSIRRHTALTRLHFADVATISCPIIEMATNVKTPPPSGEHATLTLGRCERKMDARIEWISFAFLRSCFDPDRPR